MAVAAWTSNEVALFDLVGPSLPPQEEWDAWLDALQERRRASRRPWRAYTCAEVREAVLLRASGVSYAEMGRRLARNPSSLRQALLRWAAR